jgi:proline iminopeptidase
MGLEAMDATASSVTIDQLNPAGIQVAGIRMIPVMGGRYKVWTKRMGSGPLKVLLLHGGPGFTHQYLEALESFLPAAGIEMYYYDQLGCGNSDIPDDVSLWEIPRFVEEVEDVRRGLGLDSFVLYGQSWGGMLSIEYSLKYQQHLQALVISNMTAGIQSYLKRLGELKLKLSPETQATLDQLEAAEDYDSPEYQRIMMEELYPMAICRTKPWPEPVTRAFRDANLAVYNQMQGKSEFVVTGTFKNWERWDDLHRIHVRTLVLGAENDTMAPDDLRRMATLMPNAKAAICPEGSHLAMWDDQAVYFQHLLNFLGSL